MSLANSFPRREFGNRFHIHTPAALSCQTIPKRVAALDISVGPADKVKGISVRIQRPPSVPQQSGGPRACGCPKEDRPRGESPRKIAPHGSAWRGKDPLQLICVLLDAQSARPISLRPLLPPLRQAACILPGQRVEANLVLSRTHDGPSACGHAIHVPSCTKRCIVRR